MKYAQTPRPTERNDESHRDKNKESYHLKHSLVRLEDSPAGPVARVERADRTEYAGPLPQTTVDALREVAE